MQRFKVLRQHIGDQFYDPAGEQGPAVREADAVSVAHLVEGGVLEPIKAKAAAAAPKNKAAGKVKTEKAAPENKTAGDAAENGAGA